MNTISLALKAVATTVFAAELSGCTFNVSPMALNVWFMAVRTVALDSDTSYVSSPPLCLSGLCLNLNLAPVVLYVLNSLIESVLKTLNPACCVSPFLLTTVKSFNMISKFLVP